MSDLMRMTGLYSGMDTEAIIQSMVSAKAQKVTNLKNDQKKLEWTQNIWQDLNKRIYNLYSKTLSNMRLVGSYGKKKSKISDPTKASVTATGNAVNGVQTLRVNQVAKAGYLTGAQLDKKVENGGKKGFINGTTITSSTGSALSGSDKLADIDPSLAGTNFELKVGYGSDEKTTSIAIDANTTIDDFVSKLQAGGVNASWDSTNHRFLMSASAVGGSRKNEFRLDADNENALKSLGLEWKVIESEWESSDKLAEMDPSLVGTTFKLTVGQGNDAKTAEIKIDEETSISDFVEKLNAAGVKASFDASNQRFFVSSKDTGLDKEFKLEADNAGALKTLGLDTTATYANGSNATRIDAQDAEIVLNNATFKSSGNNFSINGLSITVTDTTAADEELTISTSTDTDGMYDMIKDFVTEYNEIINDIYQKYNADSTRKYQMLSDEEKESMSEDEVEKWEDTIKGSLLRKDSTLQNIMTSLTGVINSSYEVNGKKMWLFDFGIETLNYFEAEEGERHALHILGDADDEAVSGKDDKLRAAIAEDPDMVASFFSSMCKNMYEKLGDAMKATEHSSIYKVYDDKRMKIEYEDYTKKIKDAEKKLSEYEDKWYKKFSAMEVALSKLQSNQNTITSMLGM